MGQQPFAERIQPVNLCEIYQTLSRSLGQAASSAGLRISQDNLAEIPEFKSDPWSISQIFFILMQNSIEAAFGNGDNELKIEAEKKGDCIVIKFKDNCGGIPQENIEKIFEPFFTTRKRHKGCGLGLAILKRILMNMKGDVKIRSTEGSGTQFTITFPVK